MDAAQFLNDLRAERDRIDNAITALEALGGTVAPAKAAAKAAAPAVVKSEKPTPVAPAAGTKRVISPEGRQRMAEAQKKRYAKAKRAAVTKKAAAVVPAAVKPAKAAPVQSSSIKRVGHPMSAATKKKLALAAKARWAAKKTSVKG
jgi:hypothetical protein